MARWRTAVAGLVLVFGLIAYIALAVWLIELVPEGSLWRWPLYIGLSFAWIWPALKLSRWTLKDPGTKIENLR